MLVGLNTQDGARFRPQNGQNHKLNPHKSTNTGQQSQNCVAQKRLSKPRRAGLSGKRQPEKRRAMAQPDQPRKNVLFILIDQLRADCLTGALAEHVELPNLRAFMETVRPFARLDPDRAIRDEPPLGTQWHAAAPRCADAGRRNA
jgi:hypothetical protein